MDRLITSRMRFSLQWMEGEQELSAIAPKSLTLLAFFVKISGVKGDKGKVEMDNYIWKSNSTTTPSNWIRSN